jgi:hypothetical protein
VSLAAIAEEIRPVITGKTEGLILFGSFARGDETQGSDVDVVQICPERRPSYTSGRVSVAVYTQSQLTKMARSGDLFAAHIAMEGRLISGEPTLLSALKKAFIKRSSYDGLREELRATLPLLDTPRKQYENRYGRYNSLARFILRTWIYSLLADRGEYVFSMHKVAEYLNDSRLLQVRTLSSSDWDAFRSIVSLSETYFGVTVLNPWLTPEAYLVNTEPGLHRILGLRLLNDAGVLLEYESNDK